ncbi:hypothetical protein [uncultured Kordia sp.]|uniref:hypothetical protein n=1 Tax=uncultured Kordia sp. TaxID=507699 RepID=UPI002609D1EC|nr:hypothetical protein [uncultured Kordia sp.]
MKKKRKLNLGKSKIASMNTLYKIKGGLTLGCNTDNTCPKSDPCIDELTEECTTYVETDCVTLTTKPATNDCGGFPTGACG